MFPDVLSSHALQAVPLSLLLPPSFSFNLSHHPSEFHFCPLNYFLAIYGHEHTVEHAFLRQQS